METTLINQNHVAPANPTFPVQDKFNQIIMATGLNKIEFIASMILGHHLNNPENKQFEVEIMVNDAVDVAIMLMNTIEKRVKEQNNQIQSV